MYDAFLKRLMDIVLSFIFLCGLFPVLLLVMIAVLGDTGECPFFFQKRPGKNERIFTIVKFKTMKTVFDQNGNVLPDRDRMTPFGRFLRKYSLDELPELWNVLTGKMSLVGPRPLLERYLPYYTETEKKRHCIRPGITGAAQISGRNLLDWDKRLALDVEYVDRISFRTDVRILAATFLRVFRATGVSVDPDEAELYLDEWRKGQTNR